MQVKTLTAADATLSARWDAFVERCPAATFFHRAGWAEVIQRGFGHDTFFLYAENHQGQICGVLPLGHIRSRLFSNALLSTPFGVYGGIAVNDDKDGAAAQQALLDAARDKAHRLGVDYLELRNQRRQHPDWLAKDQLYVTFRKRIDPDPDVNLKAIPRKQRAMVRKGIDAGLSGEIDDGTERLFSAYSESVRNLGTPVFGKKYFRVLKDVFGDACEVLTITKDGAVVASVMSFYFRDEVLPYYGGGTGLARRLKGNDFMYWELMRRAAVRGVRVFDYGRSKIGTGSYSFKKNWGFEPQPLCYEYYLVKARTLPDINPLNPKYRLFINLWQRLPLPLSQQLGPLIARSLG